MRERNLQTCADPEAAESQGHRGWCGCKSLLSPAVCVILNSNLNSMTQRATLALVLVFMQTEYIYYITLRFSGHGE